MVNSVVLVGRLVRDPLTKKTSSGINYTRFTLAINRNSREKITDFIPVVVWRQTADFVEKYVKKGHLVAVTGYLSASRYKNAQNEDVTSYEVSGDNVKSLETKKSANLVGNNDSFVKDLDPEMTFASETKKNSRNDEEFENTENEDIPWDIDL